MKKIIFSILFVFTLFSCSDDFLENPPATGLSEDKLKDLPSMEALVYGAYHQARDFTFQSSLYSTGMVRDVGIRNRSEYTQFFDHQLTTNMTSWMYSQGYKVVGLLNRIAVSDIDNMEGSQARKNAILADMHFLRAIIYFDLNNFWTLPSTGFSVPLVKEPIRPNDRVSCAHSEDIRLIVEQDIEQARTLLKDNTGLVADYYAATAMAARIYFYHEKYDLAYQRANEVIENGGYALEENVGAPFTPGASSNENIFKFQYNSEDGSGLSPVKELNEAYRAEEAEGFYHLNLNGELAELMLEDTTDVRYSTFFTEGASYTYIDGKYSTDQMDYVYIRLAEMYLTRAEANIMRNNSVSQQDVDDINAIRVRVNPSTMLNSIPSKEEALEILYDERTKELAIEQADHFLNVKRLEKGIVQTEQEGDGIKPYSQYKDLLAFPLPENEVAIHGLSRQP